MVEDEGQSLKRKKKGKNIITQGKYIHTHTHTLKKNIVSNAVITLVINNP